MPAVDGTNYPGPWQMRIFYTSVFASVTYTHVCTMNMDVDGDPDPGSAFGDYDLPSRSGLVYNAATWAAAIAADMADVFPTASNIFLAELWKFADGSYNAAFQSSMALDVDGTVGAGAVEDSQNIWSMRSQNGSHAFFELLHTTLDPGPKLAYGDCAQTVQDIFDTLTALDSPCLARDGGYLFSPLFYLPGRSEHLFKSRNR